MAMASSPRNPIIVALREGRAPTKYDIALPCETCLFGSNTALPEVVPSLQAERMSDQDRET